MKRIILVSCLLFCHLFTLAGNDTPIEVKSTINEVTVFLSGAQIKRSATKTLSSGTQYIKFAELSPNINPNSIQVTAKGDLTILSVTHQIGERGENRKPKEMVALEDSLKSFQFELQFNRNMKAVFEEERSMVLSNKKIGWEKAGFAVEDVEDLADFYRDRLADIMLKILELKSKEEKTLKQINRISEKLARERANWSPTASEIIVEVSTKTNTSVRFYINYLVNAAGWIPAYDLRSDEITAPVELKYNARVYQQTGVNWENVNLILSTGNPKLSGNKPELKPWMLEFEKNEPVQAKSYTLDRGYLSNGAYQLESADGNAEVDLNYLASAPIPYQAVESQTNMEFKITIPYQIPADGKRHLVNITDYELPARYKYYCAPKMDTDAFLLAQATRRDDLNLLSGDANIYFKDTYVGKSYINTYSTNDTLDLSLGRDKGVVVTRKKIKDFTNDKIVGSNKKVTLGIEITVRNTKKIPISMTLEDQIPISSDKDITVTLEEAKDAVNDKESGSLTWSVKLAPSETKTFVFKYSVKYPKDKEINL